jgi:acetyl esterase/lipase
MGAVVVGVVGAAVIPGTRAGAPTTGDSSACPQFTPMFGLMPLLFRVGVLPRPPLAATISPSDISTSVLIRPERGDQIQCGKTPVSIMKNIVYADPKLSDGKSTSLKMDIFIPSVGRRRTVVVYVPGGGFVMASKESALNLRTYVAEAGYVVASVQYRTIRDGATYRDGVEDIKAAIRYLRAHADQYGIEAGAVVVWGESAGGYLAAMVGVTNGDNTFDVGANLNQNSVVQGVIDDFGASDISKIAADFDAATQRTIYSSEGLVQYIGKAAHAKTLDTVTASAAANPLSYIKKDAPPFLLFHGTKDRIVSPSQTLILHNALTAAGAPSTRYLVDGAGHGDLSFMGDKQSGLLWSTNKVMNVILAFLSRIDRGTSGHAA